MNARERDHVAQLLDRGTLCVLGDDHEAEAQRHRARCVVPASLMPAQARPLAGPLVSQCAPPNLVGSPAVKAI